MAAIALVLAAGLQVAMPAGVNLPAAARTAPHAAPDTAPAHPVVYSAIMAHPIFAPDRAPPPAEAEDTGNLNGVTVLGTAIAGKNAAAALVRDAEGEISRIKVGEEVEGWKLVSIDKSQLVFDRNGERHTLAVDTSKPIVRRSGAPGLPGAPGAPGTTNGSTATSSDTTSDDDSDDDDSDQ